MPISSFQNGAPVASSPKNESRGNFPFNRQSLDSTQGSPDYEDGRFILPRNLQPPLQEKGAGEKMIKAQLKQLQRSAPAAPIIAPKGKIGSIRSFSKDLVRKVDLANDWPFFILFSFALLKDFFDIVFAAAGVGTLGIGAAVGIIVSFVGTLMFLILTVVTLLIAGAKLKNRGMAKYLIGVFVEFVAEALPGISWLPWTAIYVPVLYLCVLYDRSANASENQEADQKENKVSPLPTYAAADNYYKDKRLAA